MQRRHLLRSLLVTIGALPALPRIATAAPVEEYYRLVESVGTTYRSIELAVGPEQSWSGKCGACEAGRPVPHWNRPRDSCVNGIVTMRYDIAPFTGHHGLNEEYAKDMAYMLNKARTERLTR